MRSTESSRAAEPLCDDHCFYTGKQTMPAHHEAKCLDMVAHFGLINVAKVNKKALLQASYSKD